MKLPVIDRIWRVRGKVILTPPRSPGDAFANLDELFHETGTTYEVQGDTLTFRKKAPLPQDKMATFNNGSLRVMQDEKGSRLVYDLNSPTLMFCFVVPFFFLAVALLIEKVRTPGYVFAGLFVALYIVGRILEPWLIKSVFRKRLNGEQVAARETPST